MTDNEKLRYDYFIETGILWIDPNDNIELDYMKWLEAKINNTHCCSTLCLSCEKETATHGIGKTKTLCGKCWNKTIA